MNGINEVMDAFNDFKAHHGNRYDALQDQVDHIEKMLNRGALGGVGGSNRSAETERKALAAFARTGDEQAFTSAVRSNGMSVGDDTAGGYTVTPALSSEILVALREVSPMRRLARVVTIGAGDAFEEPVELSEAGAEWVGETEARNPTGDPDFGLLRVPCDEIHALVPVTQRLLDDSRFDLGAWLMERIAAKFARSEGAAYVAGNGVKKPKGLLSYATDAAGDDTRAWGTWQHVVSGSASAVTADGLRDLYWSLGASYRANASWVMSSATASAIDKLKDDAGAYLWRPSAAEGAPPTLLGRPVEFDENMPAIASNALPIAFGDFRRAYLIIDKAGTKFLRDPYSSKPNVLFYAYRRTGGGGADFHAAKLLKISA